MSDASKPAGGAARRVTHAHRVSRTPLGFLGLGVYLFHEAWCWLFNRRGLRPLDAEMKRALEGLAPIPDLEAVRLNDRSLLVLPRRFRAITLASGIYARGGLTASNPTDMRLLLHELVHVAQVRRHGSAWRFAWEYGAGVAAGWSWADHPMEVEAIAHEAAEAPRLMARLERTERKGNRRLT